MIKKRAQFDQKGTLSVLGFMPSEKPILEALYEVSYIGKTRAPFSTGETLIKPDMLKISEAILGKKAVKKIKQVPLSKDELQK